MPSPYDPDLLAELVAAPNAACKVFSYVREGINREVGNKLMTASVYDLLNMRSRRVFSEDLSAYPVGNFKRLDQNRYFETVIKENKLFSSTTIEEIAEVFFDWEKILALGFESNLNLPAVVNGEVIGTINLLHEKGHYNASRVEIARRWQPVVSLAFLLLHKQGAESHNFHEQLTMNVPPVTEGE
nr:hypothetical protein [uncultured Cohaesibacter sp.]